jgi:hypothetical protein
VNAALTLSVNSLFAATFPSGMVRRFSIHFVASDVGLLTTPLGFRILNIRTQRRAIMAGDVAVSDSKLKELILYVAKKSLDDPFYGATKLNKILFFSDFLAFKKLGKSITGATYVKLEHGPVPDNFKAIREELLQLKDAASQKTEIGGYTQDRLIHLRDPRLMEFSGEEIAIVDEMIDLLRKMSASEASEFSHRFIGWQVAQMGETIPYETVYVKSREPSAAENAYAMTLKSPFIKTDE